MRRANWFQAFGYHTVALVSDAYVMLKIELCNWFDAQVSSRKKWGLRKRICWRPNPISLIWVPGMRT